MRIILAIPYNPLQEAVGGLELIAGRLANEFIRTGHDTRIVTTGASGVVDGVTVIGCQQMAELGRWLLRNAQTYDVLQWMELFPEPDDTEMQYLWSVLLRSSLQKPVFLMVATLGNMEERGGDLWHTIVPDVFNGFVVYNSAQIVELEQWGIPRHKIDLLAAGIDTETQFYPASNEERVRLRQLLGWELDKTYVLYVGRLVQRKQADLLLTLWREHLTELHGHCELILLGSGIGYDDSIETKVRQLAGVTPSVQVCGHVADSSTYYRAADILALTSEREGEPQVLLEAMACGLPVVAYAIPGTEILDDGQSGLLCDPAHPLTLAAGIRRLVSTRELRAELGGRARQVVVEHRSISTIARKYLNFYRTRL